MSATIYDTEREASGSPQAWTALAPRHPLSHEFLVPEISAFTLLKGRLAVGESPRNPAAAAA